MSEPELDIALFASVTAVRPGPLRIPWSRLAERLAQHDERETKDGPGWSPTLYREGATRGNDGVEAVSALVLDVDHEEPDWRLLAGLEFIAHTSHKHHAGHEECDGRPGCPHWRLVLPLAAPLEPELHDGLWATAKATICPAADPASKGAARFFYLPSRPPGAPCDTRRQAGQLLDAARIIVSDDHRPRDEDRAVRDRPGADREQGDRPGDRFNAETEWADILEPAGWTRVPHNGDGERWRRPGKTEGISATADGGGHRVLYVLRLHGYVFTDNAPPLRPRTSYSRFAALAALEHGGDFSAAGRELAARYRRNGGPQDYSHTSTRERYVDSQDDDEPDPKIDFTIAPFSVMRMREQDMRPHMWAHDGLFLVGGLNGIIGTGGAGKGLFVAREIAGWTRGTIPGRFHGTPIRVLVIGDEDSADSDLIPRIVAAGGDVSLVRYLSYDQGQALSFIRHAGQLDEIAVKGGFRVVYFDQVLDHFDVSLNSHTQHDVRSALAPLRGIARRRELAAAFTMHPNKIGGQASIRDRAGGSGQFTDVSRSAIYVGYHPDREGWRAVARGKGNAGAVPPALIFRVDGTFVVNPETGEAIEAGQIIDLEADTTGLTADMILPHAPRKRDDAETAAEKVQRVAATVGADGAWRTRKELADACAEEGVPASTFGNHFPPATIVTTESGRETIWRLKQ